MTVVYRGSGFDSTPALTSVQSNGTEVSICTQSRIRYNTTDGLNSSSSSVFYINDSDVDCVVRISAPTGTGTVTFSHVAFEILDYGTYGDHENSNDAPGNRLIHMSEPVKKKSGRKLMNIECDIEDLGKTVFHDASTAEAPRNFELVPPVGRISKTTPTPVCSDDFYTWAAMERQWRANARLAENPKPLKSTKNKNETTESKNARELLYQKTGQLVGGTSQTTHNSPDGGFVQVSETDSVDPVVLPDARLTRKEAKPKT